MTYNEVFIGGFLFFLAIIFAGGFLIGKDHGMHQLHKGEFICKTIEFTGDIECKENNNS